MTLGYIGKKHLDEKHAKEAATTSTAISGKQANLTGLAGYDATKTQVLKNVAGTLTWIDEETSSDVD